jgi:hypothetical protein
MNTVGSDRPAGVQDSRSKIVLKGLQLKLHVEEKH